MRIERTRTVHVTSTSRAGAIAHAAKVTRMPDSRWQQQPPRLVSKRGTTYTVAVTFTLDTPDA